MKDGRSFAARFAEYQKERFPFVQHGPLIVTFTFSAISYSRVCRGAEGFIPAVDFVIGALTAIWFFLLLRLFDEFKDAEEDARFRPYRPVPRGLVSLPELRNLGFATALFFIAANAAAMPRMLAGIAVVLLYMFLMSREFFVRDWLKRHPLVYMASHMVIMPLIDFYTTGLDWLNAGAAPPPRTGVLSCRHLPERHRDRGGAKDPRTGKRGGRGGNVFGFVRSNKSNRGLAACGAGDVGLGDDCGRLCGLRTDGNDCLDGDSSSLLSSRPSVPSLAAATPRKADRDRRRRLDYRNVPDAGGRADDCGFFAVARTELSVLPAPAVCVIRRERRTRRRELRSAMKRAASGCSFALLSICSRSSCRQRPAPRTPHGNDRLRKAARRCRDRTSAGPT